MSAQISYRIESVPVRPGQNYTLEMQGDAFAIETGHNPAVFVSRDHTQPDPTRDIRADMRRLHIGAFQRLTFGWTLVPGTGVDHPPMRVLIVKDPRIGSVQSRVDPFDGREFRMVRQFVNGTVLPVAPFETTLLATAQLPSSATFEAGRTGFSSDVYPSGGVVASVPFVLTMYADCGNSAHPMFWQRSRPHPFLALGNEYASLDAGWQMPMATGVGIIAPAPVAQVHVTMARVPLPVGGGSITIANLTAGAGLFGATIGTVSR